MHLPASGGKVSVVNPAFFDVVFNEVHAKDSDDHVHDLRQQCSIPFTPASLEKQYKSGMQCFRRLQVACWPVGKRLAVTGVSVALEDGCWTVAQDPASIQQTLRDFWGPVYSEKPFFFSKNKKGLICNLGGTCAFLNFRL